MADVSTVLVIDDDPDIRRVARLSLGTVGGFEVLDAGCAEDAVHLAIEHLPDVILLDMSMPGTDGFGAIELLKAQAETAAIPVIAMSGKVRRRDVATCLEAGAIGFVDKPFDPMTLAAEVEALVTRVAPAMHSAADRAVR